jgi:hypothetical protein
MRLTNSTIVTGWLLWSVMILSIEARVATNPGLTVFDRELQRVRYDFSSELTAGRSLAAAFSDSGHAGPIDAAPGIKQKSPGKAFALSLLVPGLGQYYYGSRVKPFVFLGVEIAAWALEFKFHGQGDDITTEFEEFNRAHWNREDYEQKYLLWVYQKSDDDSIHEQEISHHLPDTRTQQYYEMTGKYDQFSWGWDDANIDGREIDDYGVSDPPPKTIDRVPDSPRRLWYEERRHDANSKYTAAKNMIAVAMVNHLASAFEAYFVTKSRNNAGSQADTEFSRLAVRADLRSTYARYDTPYMRLTYRF